MDVMIDLETLSTSCNAVILVIAGVKFRRDDTEIKKEHFYKKIDINSCVEKGMLIDESTKKWWSQQKEDIRKEAFEGERVNIKTALQEFTLWYKRDKVNCIWSHGATFDIPILAEAYRKCNMIPPWKYIDARDTRTVYELGGIALGNNINKHNALEDCKQQILDLKKNLVKITV